MIRVGILCPSEIAFRRFLPAVLQEKRIQYIGVAYASGEEWFGSSYTGTEKEKAVLAKEREKAEHFIETYKGKIFEGYKAMIQSGELDAVYIPLPPALHFKWAEVALQNGLHVFVEKPSTTSLADTQRLVDLASNKKLALHENYMFAFHSQLKEVQDAIVRGEIGEIRQYRINFGFPRRAQGDFRYIKALGGGALLDCGGYTLKYADILLGESTKLEYASVQYTEDFDVEVFGTAILKNKNGLTVQASFGMDNDYRCSIDAWGSKGTLTSNRILTAPEGFEPSYEISKNGEKTIVKMQADDAFLKSIERFCDCISNETVRIENYEVLLRQERLVEEFMEKSGMR